jgi:hypothetical protein
MVWRSRGEVKLEPEQVPDVLGAAYLPAMVVRGHSVKLLLIYRATLEPRDEEKLIGWDLWVELARRFGVTAAINPRGFARVAWRDRDAWKANDDAIRSMREREGSLA